MSTRSFLIPDSLSEYVVKNWVDEPEVLRELRIETAEMANSDLQISAEQGQFLTVLLKAIGAKRTLDIGVFTGYSSTIAALAVPSDGLVVACDLSDEYTQTARRYWAKAGVSQKVDLRLGPAIESLDGLIDEGMAGTFDFAFIDADKPNYVGYFERCLELIRAGGVIAADNVLWSGRVADSSDEQDGTKRIREFNRRVHADPRVTVSLVPLGDGLTVAVKA